mmetsp:Transcript_13869/g.24176  ORF Transcript_13869/g.24176 Transcript_13869/m.24176 type:complete len:288 (-) Transcript_13869:2262-3125(-)
MSSAEGMEATTGIMNCTTPRRLGSQAAEAAAAPAAEPTPGVPATAAEAAAAAAGEAAEATDGAKGIVTMAKTATVTMRAVRQCSHMKSCIWFQNNVQSQSVSCTHCLSWAQSVDQAPPEAAGAGPMVAAPLRAELAVELSAEPAEELAAGPLANLSTNHARKAPAMFGTTCRSNRCPRTRSTAVQEWLNSLVSTARSITWRTCTCNFVSTPRKPCSGRREFSLANSCTTSVVQASDACRNSGSLANDCASDVKNRRTAFSTSPLLNGKKGRTSVMRPRSSLSRKKLS